MSAASFWEALAWTKFSKPQGNRPLYQRIRTHKPTRIVELGLTDIERSLRLVRMAERYADKPVQYCGIDLFEAREVDPVTLKDAHHQLAATGAKVRLVPGDLFSSLGRTANVLGGTDLLVIDGMHTQAELRNVYHFFPRMLNESTSIARFESDGDQVRLRWMKSGAFLEPQRQAA